MRLPLILALFTEIALLAHQTASPRPTIPERLARSHSDLVQSVGIPSGLAPSVARVLAKTDVIVRGIVEEPRSYLTPDQYDVYTDYTIRNPRILYSSSTLAVKAGDVMDGFTVTLCGGTIEINGLSYKSEYEALPSLDTGQEYVLLLERVDGKYVVAGKYLGAFRVANDKVHPASKITRFATEYDDVAVDDVTSGLAAAAARAHKADR